jgi:putative transcriptional regulator
MMGRSPDDKHEDDMPSLEGHLLIASKELRDPNFARTVVLMVRHNEEGALGLILNRPLDVRLRQIWEQVSSSSCARNDAIHLGGPCEGPLMALHEEPSLGETQVVGGLYFCTHQNYLEELAGDLERNVRFFAGFSGWAAGQLEGEMDQDSWLTLPAKAQHAFAEVVDLWDQVTREVAGKRILETLKIREVPPDLRMN